MYKSAGDESFHCRVALQKIEDGEVLRLDHLRKQLEEVAILGPDFGIGGYSSLDRVYTSHAS